MVGVATEVEDMRRGMVSGRDMFGGAIVRRRWLGDGGVDIGMGGVVTIGRTVGST